MTGQQKKQNWQDRLIISSREIAICEEFILRTKGSGESWRRDSIAKQVICFYKESFRP